jgi:hypothetical protein
MFLVQVHDQVGFWRIGMIQAEADRTHAELSDGDSLLLDVGNSSGKLQDEAVRMLRGRNRWSNCCTQSNFDANLVVGGKNLHLAYFPRAGICGQSRQSCQ